ncbi:hypothetical protein L218DRAFT_990084 [Marasmius fiardii PR-910]|nr:hypothetical protein L218DRAFT_990084 [Marasmius fiardii PR-910]
MPSSRARLSLSSARASPGVEEYYSRQKQKETDPGMNTLHGWLDAFRLRIIAAAVHGYRCLITLEPGSCNSDLNFCHLVARTTNRVLLRALEHALGLYPFTLFLDSYLNLIILKVDLHHTYDNGRFLLLPQVPVLREILGYLQRNEAALLTKDKEKFYQAFSSHVWIYEFFNISYDPERSINRKRIDQSTIIGGLNRFANAEGYIDCRYPFEHSALKNLESHGHPLFMAFNAAFLLWEQSEEIFGQLYRDHESIRLVHEIGLLLTRPPPAVFFQTKPGEPNAPPSTETLDYLIPQEARYTEKLPLFKELLAEFQKARDGESDVLPGGVVSPSAKKRKQTNSSPRETRGSKLSVREFVLGGDSEVEVPEYDEAMTGSPVSPPTHPSTDAERPRIRKSNRSRSTIPSASKVHVQTNARPSRIQPVVSVESIKSPSSKHLEIMPFDPDAPRKTRFVTRQRSLPPSSLQIQNGDCVSEDELDLPKARRKRAYEDDEGQWGSKQQRKRLRRDVRKLADAADASSAPRRIRRTVSDSAIIQV